MTPVDGTGSVRSQSLPVGQLGLELVWSRSLFRMKSRLQSSTSPLYQSPSQRVSLELETTLQSRELIHRIEERGYIRYYKCDIASRDEIHRAAEAIRSDLGNPSILVNNAGIGNSSTILDVPAENLRKLFEINLLSHWSTVQEFLPNMLAKKKGHIMSVASLASFVSLAGAADYSCTKAALLAFHETLTEELKHRYKCPQIKTTIVHPGWTRTAITAHHAIEQGLKNVRARLLEPEQVAEAMVKQIIAVQNGQIVLGPKLTPSIRALPLWLQEIIRDSQANVVTLQGSTAKS